MVCVSVCVCVGGGAVEGRGLRREGLKRKGAATVSVHSQLLKLKAPIHYQTQSYDPISY